MSKHETPMTEGFWQSQAPGLFIAEYQLVERGADRASRKVDGLILPDEPNGRGKWRDHVSLTGKRVIVIQSKARPYRMGMYLMGQALFSARAHRLVHHNKDRWCAAGGRCVCGGSHP
jgi:hypothetical protein